MNRANLYSQWAVSRKTNRTDHVVKAQRDFEKAQELRKKALAQAGDGEINRKLTRDLAMGFLNMGNLQYSMRCFSHAETSFQQSDTKLVTLLAEQSLERDEIRFLRAKALIGLAKVSLAICESSDDPTATAKSRKCTIRRQLKTARKLLESIPRLERPYEFGLVKADQIGGVAKLSYFLLEHEEAIRQRELELEELNRRSSSEYRFRAAVAQINLLYASCQKCLGVPLSRWDMMLNSRTDAAVESIEQFTVTQLAEYPNKEPNDVYPLHLILAVDLFQEMKEKAADADMKEELKERQAALVDRLKEGRENEERYRKLIKIGLEIREKRKDDYRDLENACGSTTPSPPD